jgi:hypothetical protein
MFQSRPEDAKALASGLVELQEIVRSVSFSQMENGLTECRVVTPQPEQFCDELVRIAVERHAPVLHLDTLSESIEKLFEYLIS